MTKVLFSLFALTLAFNSTITSAAHQVPTLALTFDTNVKKINMTSSQRAKIEKAEDKIKRVIASEEFKRRVIGHTYNGQKTFVDNNGLTNTQIYYKLLKGAEELQSTQDNELDVEVELYYEGSSTVGYTYYNTKRIYMNTKFFNSYTSTNVSGNLMHEWLHKLGFDHDFNYSYSRDFSVPYAIGYLIEELAAKL